MNIIIKRCLIFVIVIFMLIGIVSATELSDNSSIAENSIEHSTKDITNEISSNIQNNDDNIKFNQEKQVEHIEKNTTRSMLKQANPDGQTNKIILNSTTFHEYVTDGKFNDKVNPGDVIDVQGLLDSPLFSLTVNKPVNITSTTGDVQWGEHTIGDPQWGKLEQINFTIDKSGAGSNISNINFRATRIVISNTTDINIDNITNTVKQSLSASANNIEGLSKNIKITNSYFYSEQLGTWSCNFKVSGVDGLLIENCTFIEVGYCMNNVYLQIAYNIAEEHKVNNNITLRNCTLDGLNAVSQAASCGLVMQGSNILIENCTLKHNSTDTYAGENYIVMGVWIDLNWGTGQEGENIATDLVSSLVFRNNIIEGDHNEGGEVTFSAFPQAKIYGNVVRNVTTWVGNQEVYNNTFEDTRIVKNNTTFTNNRVEGNLNVSNFNFLENNTILGLTNVTGVNNTFKNNLINNLMVEDEENNTFVDNENVIVFTDENISDYMTISDNQAVLSDDVANNSKIFINLKRNDIKVLNVSTQLNNVSLTILNSSLYHIIINPESMGVSFINCDLPNTSVEINTNHALINSTFLYDAYTSTGTYINTKLISESNPNILTADSSLDKGNYYENYFNTQGYLTDTLENNSVLIIRNTPTQNSINGYTKSITINKPVNITSYDNAYWNASITFITGSQGSNISNMKINEINVYSNNITIKNNTITQLLKLENTTGNIAANNTFTQNSYINIKNSTENKFYENTVNTTNNNTIQIDDLSENNEITRNTLISKDSTNKYSIKNPNTNNRIYNNYPYLNVNMTILMENTTVINDTEIPIDITIDFEKEFIPGNLVMTLDGVLKENISMNQNNINYKLKLNDTLGNKNIKLHYYPNDLYPIIINQKDITVKKLNTNININYTSVKITKNTTITALVTDEYGNNIPDGYVDITFADINTSVEIEDGIAALNIPALEEYTGQTINAYYNGTPSMANSTNKTVFNTLKGDVNIILHYETQDNNTVITAAVTNMLGQSITSGYLQFKGAGVSKLVKIESNQTSLTIPTPTGETTIVVSFRNNPNYENTNNSITIYSVKNSVITVNTIDDVDVGDSVTISGRLTDTNNNPINGVVNVFVNDDEYIIDSDDDGNYQLVFTVTKAGINNVCVVFEANERYTSSQAITSFITNKKNTTFQYYNIKDADIGTTLKISAKLLSDGVPVKGQNVIVTVNGEDFTAKTSTTGYFVLEYITDTAGVNNITFIYDGNDEYNGVTNNTSFRVVGQKKDTSFLYYGIKEVNLGETVKISAKLLSDGQPVKGQSVTVTVNDDDFTAKTSSTGYFVVEYPTTTAGINNITFIYAGNSEYIGVTNNTTFRVVGQKKDTSFLYYNIKDMNIGDNVKISAKLLSEGQPVKGQNVIVTVNGEDFTAKTSTTGYFAVEYVTSTAGVNNITFIYDGNDEYNGVTNSTSFRVVGQKKDTSFLYYGIKEVNLGETVKISAKLLSDGQPVKGQSVTVTVNGEVFVVKTSSTGYFVLEYVTSTAGLNNITFIYDGNDEYNAVANNSKFNAIGQKDPTTFLYYKIKDVKMGDAVKISAKLLSDGQPVKSQSVTVTVNGEVFVVKTSSTGYFVFDYISNTIGINNVTFVYDGNEYYMAVTNSTQFTCIA